ncbi:MAG: 30S ribosome-binding factor RbfA [Acidimicrobiia bacterium]|nr:30S ribosome-binding factor RbfA [Acidimicrobiia bacterium]MBT8214299.1 30S ribosome-binding factor RbfA [Acidimicrobiia bacterium]NNF68245.1 30S ribosome-binding factor RbfA [Acidimicrobiia bacterium]NNK91421.1 30S ribosome-binding factor RbfA [Acidimicrobiia bacterium]
MRKINELLREVIAEQVGDLKDPRIGFVTVTAVDTAPDLRHATVFYTVLGDEDTFAETHEALEHAAPYLQSIVARQVRIKYIPKIHFRVDETIERAMRINRILHDIEEE